MLRRLILNLLGWLSEQFDPEFQRDLEQYREKRRAVEATIAVEQGKLKTDAARLELIESERAGLETKIVEELKALQTLKDERKRIEYEKSQELQRIAGLSDRDALRSQF